MFVLPIWILLYLNNVKLMKHFSHPFYLSESLMVLRITGNRFGVSVFLPVLLPCTDRAEFYSLSSKMTNYMKSGTNNIGNIIVPGYNTGSGNYIDCFVPCSTGGKTVSSASASSSTIVYLPTKRISFSSAPTITVLETNAYGVRLELAYPSTETANINGTVYLVNLMLTCS